MDRVSKIPEVIPEAVRPEQTPKVHQEQEIKTVTPETVAPQEAPVKESLNEKQAKELRASMDNLNKIMSHFNRKVKFSEYKDTDRWYIQVIDSDTNEVVKTVPPEQMLELMERIDELIALFVDEKG